MDAPSNKRAFHVAFVDKQLTLIENGVNYFAPWSTVWIACGGFCPEFLYGEAIGMCNTLTDEMPRPPRPPPRLWPSLCLNRAEVGIIDLCESSVCSGIDLDVCSDTETELESSDRMEIDSSQSDVHCPDTLLDETQPGSPIRHEEIVDDIALDELLVDDHDPDTLLDETQPGSPITNEEIVDDIAIDDILVDGSLVVIGFRDQEG
jgi:hypothetical protein